MGKLLAVSILRPSGSFKLLFAFHIIEKKFHQQFVYIWNKQIEYSFVTLRILIQNLTSDLSWGFTFNAQFTFISTIFCCLFY